MRLKPIRITRYLFKTHFAERTDFGSNAMLSEIFFGDQGIIQARFAESFTTPTCTTQI